MLKPTLEEEVKPSIAVHTRVANKLTWTRAVYSRYC